MKHSNFWHSAALILLLGATAFQASAQDVLTGDAKSACEAILCLASPTKPEECNPALQRYYSIKSKKAKDTAKNRQNFLNLCPKK